MSSAGTFFNSFAETFDTLYDGKRNRLMRYIDWRFRRCIFIRFTMTFERFGDLSHKHVIDIGCGSGPYIAEALRNGAEKVTGLDPAPEMLKLARQRVSELEKDDSVEFIEGYFPATKLGRDFDYAIVMGVMDYVDSHVEFLKALAQVIKTGAVLSFPSRHWLRTPIRKFRYTIRGVPLTFFTQDDIAALMADAGINTFEITKIPGAGMDYFVWIEPD